MAIQFSFGDHTVRYACGHTRIVRFYGDDEQEIDKLIARHESVSCPDCPPMAQQEAADPTYRQIVARRRAAKRSQQ